MIRGVLSTAIHRMRLIVGGPVRQAVLAAATRGRLGPSTTVGAVRDDAVPVIMCLWNRPDRLEPVLALLAAQTADRPIRLVLWNNHRGDHRRYRELVQSARLTGALQSIELTQSPLNIGGVGRFCALARLRRRGVAGPVVLLDDDQDIGDSFVSDLLKAYEPRSVKGVWAFGIAQSYWNRWEIADGAPASYVGTGGCVLDAALVDDRRWHTRLPRRYLFVEDVWMNFVALRQGWTLAKAASPFTFVQEEKNQYHRLIDLKESFYSELQTEQALKSWDGDRATSARR